MDSDVPSRNPLSYCRLCLSQVNLLTVLGSSDDANQPHIKEVLQKLHHYTKVALLAKDFPCAICGVCKTQLNEFHAFRRNVMRNHNAVQIFRQTFGDEIERAEPEEEETYVEIIEDSQQLADLIREEYGDTMELKEVDVYHVNGELRTVVVKADPDAKPPSPQQQVRAAPKKTPPAGPRLARLDLSQITIKRTKFQENAADRLQCDHCQLTYKTLHNLNKHLIEVHKVMPRPTEKHICSLCNLSYSCYQDLQLHIRALHSIRCTTCAADNRQCSHKPPAVGNGVGKVNKATA
ncbi:hypothetical protein pipiens_012307 [Culex pipiens pipiens]|uniref:ZAD domain-containing protein n=1 Tax=Culex pipiens pipiens TaxID=38569 RepID=A0ABD1D5T1_CULPP